MILQDGCFKTSRSSILQSGRKTEGEGFWCSCTSYWENCNSILRKYVVPAAKRIGADTLEFAVPEIGEVISGRKSFKTAAKSVGKQTLRKQLGEGEGSRRRTVSRQKGSSKRRRIIPTKSTKQSSRSRRDIFTNISR